MIDPRLWRDDRSAVQCTACATTFSLFRCRRHHCRHCGGIFCDACTEKRLWLRPWASDAAAGPAPIASETAQRAALLPTTAAPSPVALPASRAVATSSVSASSEPVSAPRSTSEGSNTNSDGATADRGAAGVLATAAATPLSGATSCNPASCRHRCCHSAATRTRCSNSSNSPTTTSNATPSSELFSGTPAAAGAGRVFHCGRCSTSGGGLTTSSMETDLPVPLAVFQPAAKDTSVARVSEGPTNSPVAPGAAAATRQSSMVTPVGAMHAGSDGQNGVGVTVHHSRRVSSSIFSGSLYAVSPASNTGDRLSQAWAGPELMVSPEQGGTSRLPRTGSGAALGAGQASACVSSTSGSSPLHRGASDHVDPLVSQRHAPPPQKDAAAPRAQAATGSLAIMARRAAAARSRRGNRDADLHRATVAEDMYRRESYDVEVDAARCVTWYLCRVCRHCYDHFLDVILDAHETPTTASGAAAVAALGTAAAAAALHSSARLPLWYYVRLCASATGSPPRTAQKRNEDSFVLSANASPTSASVPLWSYAWARLRNSMSLSRASSSAGSRATSITASPVTANVGTATLPSLQTGELCRTRDGSGLLSPSMSAPEREDALLSFSTLSIMSSQPTQLAPRTTAPPAQQQAAPPPPPPHAAGPARAQRSVTPPRRRLISIDGNGPGPTRQAVAVARRRRRIAVLLIDERDVAPATVAEGVMRGPVPHRFPSAPLTQPIAKPSPLERQLPVQPPPASRPAESGTPATAPDGVEDEVNLLTPPVAEGGGGVGLQPVASATATHKAVHRPKLSIVVGGGDDNVIEEANAAAAAAGGGGGGGSSQSASMSASVLSGCGGGDGVGATAGFSPAEWLAPHLPAEASAWLVHEEAGGGVGGVAGAAARAALLRSSPAANACGGTSPETSPSLPSVSGAPATSHPISCTSGGPPAAHGTPATTAATAGAGMGGAGGHHAEGKLPALPLAAESARSVLRALFAQIGASVRFSATPATTASISPTLASAAAAAAAAAMNGGAFRGASSAPRWGTGPDSYAAQRQALVRDMLARYQHQSAVAAGVSSPFALSGSAPGFYLSSGGGGDMSRDGSCHNVNGGVGGHVYAGTPRAGGTASMASAAAAAAATSNATAAAAFERVMAAVTTYFQIRRPPSVVRVTVDPTALPILPVLTQVELVGIPIDTSATCTTTAFTSTRGWPNGTMPSAAASSLASMSGITGAAARPFTLAEFLPQLAKLSTNLDGYVVVVLRRHARWRGDSDLVTTPSAASGDVAAQLTSATTSGGVGSAGAGSDNRFTSFALSDDAHPSRSPCPSSALPRQSRRRRLRNCHHHRVTVPFDGSHLRQIYQQLLSCGVAQPALSVVEVCDDELRPPAAAERSPGSVASNSSPTDASSFGEEKSSGGAPRLAHLKPRVPGVEAERGATAGVADAAAGHCRISPQLCCLSRSGLSVGSSSDSTPPHAGPSAEHTPLPPPATGGGGKNGNLLERLQLPSAVVVAHGATAAGRSTIAGSAAPTTPPATASPAGATRTVPSARESATASLHATCRQLDVTMSTLTYATSSTAAPAVPFPSAPTPSNATGENPMLQKTARSATTEATTASAAAAAAAAATAKSPSGSGSAGGGSAFLARALESLVTTLVYRDLHGTLAP